jgi:hypothetical protein
MDFIYKQYFSIAGKKTFPFLLIHEFIRTAGDDTQIPTLAHTLLMNSSMKYIAFNGDGSSSGS